MDKILSAIMAFLTFLFSLTGIHYDTPEKPYETDESFTPVIRFTVCSDTHIDAVENKKTGRIPAMFDFAYSFAEQSSYTALDAALFAGDLTNNGTDEQFAMWEREVNRGIREGTQLLSIVAKNHDGYVGAVCRDKIEEITGLDADFHVVINGFHFIGISRSPYDDIRYTVSQRTWLINALKEAEKDDPEKPIFVMHHEHVFNTVYGSSLIEGWGVAHFTDILNDYPRVVDFSGHSHYPVNDPRSVLQKNFTTVGTGSMAYMEMTYKTDRSIHPAGNDDAAQAWIVEVDAENRVRLTGFDVLNKEILCRYILPCINDPEGFTFTEGNMVQSSLAPVFDEDARLEVSDNGDGTYTVTAPAANSADGRIIFLYRVRVFGSMGIQTSTEYMINNYWQNDTYDTVSFTVEASSGSRIEITAENAYKMESAPLTATV